MRIKPLLPIALDGLVVVIVVTVIAAIAALLPYAFVHWRLTYAACVGIAVLGAASVIYQLWRLYQLDRSREAITELLAEGHQLVLGVRDRNPGRPVTDYPIETFADLEDHMVISDWCKQAEDVLRERLGESYVTRFHLGGSNIMGATSMTIWKMNHRLNPCEFLN